MTSPSLPLNQIILGDCVEVMRSFPENSVDLIATDPPYGLTSGSPKEAEYKVSRVLSNILFPNLDERDVHRLQEILLSGVSLDGSFLSYMKAIRTIFSRVGMPPSTINLDNPVKFREEKVYNKAISSLRVAENSLSLETDVQGGKCLGDYILYLGVAPGEATPSDLVTRSLAENGFSQITMFIRPVFPSGDPCLLSQLLVIWGMKNNIRLLHNSLRESKPSTPILTNGGTVDTFMLTFNLNGKTIELSTTHGTDASNSILNPLFAPHLIRASSGTSGLTAPLQTFRIGIIDPSTNQASPFYFNLVVQTNRNDEAPLITFMRKISDSYSKGGFMSKSWDKALPQKEAFAEMHRVLKPGALAFVMSSPRQDVLWRMLAMLEDSGFELKQSFISHVYASGFPKAFDLASNIDKKKGLKPVPTKINPSSRPNSKRKNAGGFDNFKGKKESAGIQYLTEPTSDEAKRWSGWKSITGLKPALEVVLMVNKPFSEKTIVDNVLRWGTGAINVDACRIPIEKQDDIYDKNPHTFHTYDANYGIYQKREDSKYEVPEGRFPANLLVSDDALNDGKITKSSIRSVSKTEINNEGNYRNAHVYGDYRENLNERGIEDLGSFSRYFDLDAWAKHHGFLNVPKADTGERDYGLHLQELRTPKSKFNLNDGSKDERFDGAKLRKRRNIHPTVKPVQLMAYLIELGCPPDGVVLDPFLGSGTTCIAAKRLRRRYIGIEIDPEYHELAVGRVAAYPEPLDWIGDGEARDE